MNAAKLPRALLLFLALAFPVASFAHWDAGVSVNFAPPELPVYEQPPCPSPGYLWMPGYWAYSADDQDYYWVPGTWVLAPAVGLLFTPGYWAFGDAGYRWHAGYWGPHVGFYGGINYGFGYFGSGYGGGHWRGHDFYYNRAVNNVRNVNVTHIYNSTVINERNFGNRASFNGGNGVHAQPNRAELRAEREPHRDYTAPQRYQAQAARGVTGSLAAVNHGHPPIAATARAGRFNTRAVEPAQGAAADPRSAPAVPMHANNPLRSRSPAAPISPESARPVQHSPFVAHNERTSANGRSGYSVARNVAPIGNEHRAESRPAPGFNESRPSPYRPARPVPSAPSNAQRAPAAAAPSMPRNALRPQAGAMVPHNEDRPRGAPSARPAQGHDSRPF